MYTCPTKDIHSVYLDNELPLVYVKEYEEHVSSCKKCQEELARIKKVRSFLSSDASSITPDSVYLDESFKRLQVKMNYSKHILKSENKFSKFSSIQYLVPVAAAAAVFAVVFSFNLSNSKASQFSESHAQISLSPVKQNTATVSMNAGQVVSGNIPQNVMLPPPQKNSLEYKNILRSPSPFPVTVSSQNCIPDVDVYSPNFDNMSKVSIKITVPGMNYKTVTTEVELPVEFAAGNYK